MSFNASLNTFCRSSCGLDCVAFALERFAFEVLLEDALFVAAPLADVLFALLRPVLLLLDAVLLGLGLADAERFELAEREAEADVRLPPADFLLPEEAVDLAPERLAPVLDERLPAERLPDEDVRPLPADDWLRDFFIV